MSFSRFADALATGMGKTRWEAMDGRERKQRSKDAGMEDVWQQIRSTIEPIIDGASESAPALNLISARILSGENGVDVPAIRVVLHGSGCLVGGVNGEGDKTDARRNMVRRGRADPAEPRDVVAFAPMRPRSIALALRRSSCLGSDDWRLGSARGAPHGPRPTVPLAPTLAVLAVEVGERCSVRGAEIRHECAHCIL